MIPGFNEPFPYDDVIVKPNGKASGTFVDWLDFSLNPRLQATPVVTESLVTIADGNTAVGVTPIGGDQSAGLYRVSYYAEVLVGDAVSQSLQLTITWTHNGKTLTRTYAAMTALPTTTTQGIVDCIQVDGGSPVSYTLAYASNTAGVFHYTCSLGLELIQLIS